VALFEILSQRETPHGWSFEVQMIGRQAGQLRRIRLALSWADYNHWSVDGSDRANEVAEAVLAFLISRMEPQTLPPRFDASIARRQFTDADREIPKLIPRREG
jgi:hypothetical protein